MRPCTPFWRKLSVLSILLEIFRRLNATSIAFCTSNAMLSVFGVESSPTVRKMRPFTRFWRKLSVISLLLEIFRHLIAISIALYTPNATYAVFSVERIPTVRKMRSCTRFWKKLCVISLLLEIFRRLYCIFNAFYTPIAARAVFSVGTSPTVRKLRPFTPFRRKLRVVSNLLEIFRRLNATSIAFYTSNAMLAVFGVERSRPVRKMRPFTRFWRELRAISLLLAIFRRLYAISISFSAPSAMYASFIVESSRPVRKMRSCTRFWRQTVSYFAIVGDLSPFKRYFHRILHAAFYVRRF